MEVGSKIPGLEENLVHPQRRFLFEGKLSLINHKLNAKSPVGDYAYMFNDMLLYCTKKQGYVDRLWMHQLVAKDARPDLPKNSFEVAVVDGEVEDVWMMTAPDSSNKETWLLQFGKAIRDVERTRKVFGMKFEPVLSMVSVGKPLMFEQLCECYDYRY